MKMLKTRLSSALYILYSLTITFFLTFTSCEKDDDDITVPTTFAEIGLEHIKAEEPDMSSAGIAVSDATGIIWETGDVYVYKTAEGRYGKFEVLEVDQADNYKLTLKITNYAGDGSVFLATNSVEIRGSYLCDLDIVAETSETPTDDFHWNRLSETNTSFDPRNGAKFVKYVFES